MKIKYSLLFLLFLGLVACTANGGDETAVDPTSPPPTLTTIRLPMGYIPDPQYAPYYVAVEKGYYAEAGIEIEFDYSFETDGMALVGANETQFAIVSGEQVVLAGAQGVPVVYVLEWFQKYPITVVSKADANITSPADLVGRSVGIPGFFGASYVGAIGLLSANEMTQDETSLTEIGFTQVETLLAGQADAVVGYANNEPVQLEGLGEEINVLYVSDYIDMVANGIITNQETVTNNPELVQGFVNATLRGLQDALNDPEEAFEISKKYVEGLEDDRMPVLEASLPLWQAEDQLGYTDASSWQQTEAILLEMGFLDAPVDDLDSFYTNQFVEAGQP